ncbi:MAG: AarF/ABC1/UbiB kinase family protein [Myxococcales bacterium]|nr:MAG: AarF/ABC1/UbiB kinase family protein [Myxococcales bacterium]
MAETRGANRSSRVPSGRVERLARLGVMAGGLAAGAVAEGARRLINGGEKITPAKLLLTERNARQLAKNLSRMRGAAMKLGQLISLEGDVSVPAEFADALTSLRSDSDMMPPAQLHRVLGREYGHGWEKQFSHFGEVPVAAASIGQVHRAVTRDGRELALKIQYPGVARSIGSDVDNLATLLKMTRILPSSVKIDPMVREVKRQLRRETDYLAEARSLSRYAALLADDPMFRVPRVHEDLTTKRILAMDYLEGRPLQELWESQYSRKIRDRVGTAMQRLVFRELFEFGFMQSDPNFANYLFSPENGTLILLDFGSAIELQPQLSDGYARLSIAVVENDRETIREVAIDFGLIREDEREDRVSALTDLVILCCEPLRARGSYDYGQSDLAARARDAALDLAFELGLLRPPPPQAIFIHRKLGGTFLLCRRLGARIDTPALFREHLPRAA